MAEEIHRRGADQEKIAGIGASLISIDFRIIMPVTALNHYNLRAPRPLLDAIRNFYCDVVGLKEGARPPFNFFGYWLYAGNDPILHLVEAHGTEQRGAGEFGTFDHVAFTCHGRREMEAQLLSRGVAFRVAEVPGAGQVQFFLKDPAGNGVELNFSGDDA